MSGTGEPASKRVRQESDEANKGGEDDHNIDKLLEQAETVQKQVEGLIDEENKEVAKVQDQYAKMRVEVYEKRSKIFEQIPHFWSDVVLRSSIADFLNDDDVAIMEHLTEIKFVESSNPVVTLCFEENPYFSNKEIVKSFRVVEDGLESQVFDIDWKPGRNVAARSKARVGGKGFGKQRRERDAKESFFLWFSNEAAFDENSMVDAIRDIYQYPVSFFNKDDGEDQSYEEEQNSGGKIRGSKAPAAGEEEEEFYEEDDEEEEEGGDDYEGNSMVNGRSISPLLRGNDDEDDGNDNGDDDYR